MVPSLIDKISLFIPELPGYGISTPAQKNSRKDIGGALLEALQKVFGTSESSPRRVVLGGHDRGARVCHRLAVSRHDYPFVNVIGAVLVDIVPTKVQWDRFADPVIATGYFHWPLLANVEVAVSMLKAFGGANWCRSGHFRVAGSNEAGVARLKADDAVEIHAALFDKEETLRYSCEDYAAGAAPECEEQAEDQKAGRKIDVPTMVMFSKAKLGARTDVAEEWTEWITPGVSYEPVPIGDGYGHFLPEEATDIVSEKILSFLKAHA